MNWILDRILSHGARSAVVSDSQSVSYIEIHQRIGAWQNRLHEYGINSGSVVAVIGDYSPEFASLLLALLINRNIVVPLTFETRTQHPRFLQLAGVEFVFEVVANNRDFDVIKQDHSCHHEYIQRLQQNSESGLVLFTSGTSGESKGAVLSVDRLFEKFRKCTSRPEKALRSLVFLKLDHIGGINTLCSILFSGGTAISIAERSPAAVCAAIETHRVELLPTTPTFLNMLLLSAIYKEHNLSSLKMITYGTEPMPKSTLLAVNRVFPEIKLKQTYGLTELGIFATRSRDSSSDWLMIGGEGVETRVVNNILHIRTRNAMLGYLNASSPFTDDGWYITGDQVEIEGDYFRILGRDSEIINVSGEKVYPAEVENALLEMDNVRDVLVQGKPNPVTGHIVTAQFFLDKPEDRRSLHDRVHGHCRDRLEPFKVPKLIGISEQAFVGSRLKKMRNIQLEA